MVATVLVLSFKLYSGHVWVIAAVFLISGLVMASRLFQSAHTPGQVYSGFFLGLVVMVLALNV
jgi:hypothetical protein